MRRSKSPVARVARQLAYSPLVAISLTSTVMRRSRERRNAHVEAVADLQRLDQILAQVEVDPEVVEIDQRHQRHAGRDVFARLDVALVDLRGHRRVDHHLIDDRLHGLDVGDRLLTFATAIWRSSAV